MALGSPPWRKADALSASGLGNAKRGRSFESAGSPIVLNGQVIGAMGVSSGDGERCAQAAIDIVFKGRATTVGR